MEWNSSNWEHHMKNNSMDRKCNMSISQLHTSARNILLHIMQDDLSVGITLSHHHSATWYWVLDDELPHIIRATHYYAFSRCEHWVFHTGFFHP